MHRTKVEGDEATQRRVPTVEAHVSMHGAQVVFDKQVWKDLYSWIIEGPLEQDFEKQTAHFLELFQQKREEGTLADLKDFYYMNAKFNMAVRTLPPLCSRTSLVVVMLTSRDGCD
jgi:hypothetical protein